jgi:hypothetical protein
MINWLMEALSARSADAGKEKGRQRFYYYNAT